MQMREKGYSSGKLQLVTSGSRRQAEGSTLFPPHTHFCTV